MGEAPKLLVSKASAPAREISHVDLAHEVGPRAVQDLGAVLAAEEVLLDVEMARLDLGSDGPVEKQHALGSGSEETVHGALIQALARTASAAGGAAGLSPRMWQMA